MSEFAQYGNSIFRLNDVLFEKNSLLDILEEEYLY